MQQDCALGNPCRAAGVLQHGNIVERGDRLLERGFGAQRHCGIKAHSAWQVVGRHHFFDIAHHVIDKRAFE